MDRERRDRHKHPVNKEKRGWEYREDERERNLERGELREVLTDHKDGGTL